MMISKPAQMQDHCTTGELESCDLSHNILLHDRPSESEWMESKIVRLQQRLTRLEDAVVAKGRLLGDRIPIECTVSHGPDPAVLHVLGHLDHCEIVRDRHGQYHLILKGWAWSPASTVIAVDLFLDGSRWYQLDYGTYRKDVRNHFDGASEMAYCGFSTVMQLPKDYHPQTPCMVQVCDWDGRWKRFELHPRMTVSRIQRSMSLVKRLLRSTQVRLKHSFIQVRSSRYERLARRLVERRSSGSEFFASLILAVGDEPQSQLRRSIDSLRSQIDPRWRLLLAPFGAIGRKTTSQLITHSRGDARIVNLPITIDTRSQALSEALRVIEGPWVGVLEPGIQLSPDAIAWSAETIRARPQMAWLYADGEDCDESGSSRIPDRKPDFSELHLWSRFFTAGFSLYERRCLIEADGFHETPYGVEEYDLVLRMARRLSPDRIVHLSESLFTRRLRNPRMTVAAEPAQTNSAAAVAEVLARAGVSAGVVPHVCGQGVQRIEIQPRSQPSVVVVIPTRDKATLLRRCVESLRRSTRYENYRVLVINNESTEPDLFDFFDENDSRPDFARVDYARPFNHSAICNEALADVRDEYAVLLNNDLSDFSEGWLEQFVGVAELDRQVAGVGALLTYPDRRVQHGGVIIGLHGRAAHSHLDVSVDQAGYQGRLHCLQDLSACTAACLLIRLSAFREVGGFRPQEYPTAFNDVDLCVRLQKAGYRCVYQPAVSAVHYESVSRGITLTEADRRIAEQLADESYRDPYYNQHLSRTKCFQAAQPPADARMSQWKRFVDRFGRST